LLPPSCLRRLWQSLQSWSNSGTHSRVRATAIERAIDRLRSDLIRQGVICDTDQQGLLGAQIGERGP
jgi:hypothetical protein